MTMVARRATPGYGCDTSSKIGKSTAETLVSVGFTLVARYVPLPYNSPAHDIDAAGLALLADAGLEVLLVQHVRTPPWDPATHSAMLDAAMAVSVARAAGYPQGAHLFLDLEGIAGSSMATKAFAESWAAAVVAAGYLAGVYVGYDVPLDAMQLYTLHGVNSYWSDAGPRHVATRGFALKQHAPPVNIAGIEVDRDDVQEDAFGETPMVAAKALDLDALVANDDTKPSGDPPQAA